MRDAVISPYDEAKQRLAQGVKVLGKDHEDVVIHDREFYRIRVEKLRDPEEIEGAIRKMTEEATQ